MNAPFLRAIPAYEAERNRQAAPTDSDRGAAFLLKLDQGEGYETVAALRVVEMSRTKDGALVTGKGIMLGSAAEAAVRSHALEGSIAQCELSFEGSKYRGPFLIFKLDYVGCFNGERNYSVQLESAGKVVSA